MYVNLSNPLHLQPNGTTALTTMDRCVVVSKEMTVRPVATAVRNGPHNQRHTLQQTYDGDYRIVCEWPTHGQMRRACQQYVNGDWVPAPSDMGKQIWQVVVSGTPLERFFNKPQFNQTAYLPEGFGWDGKWTVSDLKKQERIRRFFTGCPDVWLNNLLEQATVSPAQECPTLWPEGFKIPELLDAPSTTWSGHVVAIKQYTEWVLWHADGRVEVITPKPTSGEWGTNYKLHPVELGDPQGVYHNDILPIPDTVVRACKITRGAYENQFKSYGVSWDLFTNETFTDNQAGMYDDINSGWDTDENPDAAAWQAADNNLQSPRVVC